MDQAVLTRHPPSTHSGLDMHPSHTLVPHWSPLPAYPPCLLPTAFIHAVKARVTRSPHQISPLSPCIDLSDQLNTDSGYPYGLHTAALQAAVVTPTPLAYPFQDPGLNTALHTSPSSSSNTSHRITSRPHAPRVYPRLCIVCSGISPLLWFVRLLLYGRGMPCCMYCYPLSSRLYVAYGEPDHSPPSASHLVCFSVSVRHLPDPCFVPICFRPRGAVAPRARRSAPQRRRALDAAASGFQELQTFES
ncbi:hypothetical protein C8Q79DRAFT_676606 [Trametes meyenii]|nr:hypothetical protein C8Q79DRAFT_676606 [Trametes meyenii]